MKKQLLSTLLALSMIFSIMPTSLLTSVSADSTYTFLDIENVVYDSTGHLKSITVKSNQSNSAIAGTEDVVLTLALGGETIGYYKGSTWTDLIDDEETTYDDDETITWSTLD